jgi:hypothetical protein
VVLERVNVLTRYAPGERYTNADFRANYGGASEQGGREQGRADAISPPIPLDERILQDTGLEARK